MRLFYSSVIVEKSTVGVKSLPAKSVPGKNSSLSVENTKSLSPRGKGKVEIYHPSKKAKKQQQNISVSCWIKLIYPFSLLARRKLNLSEGI